MSDALPHSGPSATARFCLFLDGFAESVGEFTECYGLQVDVEIEEVQEGGQNQFVHRLPGRMKWPNIVFKRGLVDPVLFNWLQKVSGDGFAGNGNKIERATGRIVLYANDFDGKPIREWSFVDGYPVKWRGPKLVVSENAVVTEELEIAHHGFTAR